MVACVACFDASAHSEQAPEQSELERLAAHVRTHPTDYEQTFAYIRLATELHDEAAIGALERLLMYNPALGRARKELGFLYARIGAYQSAVYNLRAALKSADLDRRAESADRSAASRYRETHAGEPPLGKSADRRAHAIQRRLSAVERPL